MKLTELTPYENNPRRNDEAVEGVAESIKQFGWQVPIVVDKNGVIVCGHTRYKAAKKLKMKTVPVVIADDLTEEQIKAYRLADNKVSEKAEWDLEKLADELADIDLDMSVFGFDFDVEETTQTDITTTSVKEQKKQDKILECPNCGFRFETL